MFLFCLHKDQNVIQVHHYDPFSYESSKDVVHHSLEGDGTVGHFKEHHERLEETAVGVEGRLLFIPRLDTYVIETPSDVKLCEVLGSAELEDELGDEGEGILVLDSCGIQHAIVLDQPERAILLFNEEHWSCDGGLGGSNSSGMQVLL